MEHRFSNSEKSTYRLMNEGHRARQLDKVSFDTAEPDGERQNVLLFVCECRRVQVEGGPKTCDPVGLARMKAEMGDPIIVDGKPYVPPKE